jgi:glycosyltransferase involved in cell wall biosynthesis
VEPNRSPLPDGLPAAPPGRKGWPWTAEAPPPADLAEVRWPRISIVTPSFQQAAFVEECLRSVLLQGYPNLEYLVMDGGSRDGSPEIIARYAPYLSYWQSRADSGQGDAINQGFERASGEILGWLNSDDLLLPGALIAVARAFLNGNPDIVYGDALNAFEDDHTLQYWQGYWVTPSFLQFGGVISSHSVFWRRSIHVPLWADLNCNIDGELWQRLVPGRRLRYLPQPLGVCRIHGDTKSSSAQWSEKWRRDDEMIWARHGRPTSSRVFRQWFARSQGIFKWVNWRRSREARRSVIAACGWEGRGWRGPRP